MVEVSDSTLLFDVNVKRDLYARAGISEYWTVDVNGRRVVVHRDPAMGRYQSISAYDAADSIGPLNLPVHSVCVGDLFK